MCNSKFVFNTRRFYPIFDFGKCRDREIRVRGHSRSLKVVPFDNNNNNNIVSGCACTDDSYLQSYLSSWSSSFGPIPDTLPARQPFWDRPGIQADRLLVKCSLSSAFHRASFLAASSKHSGDWLYALPVTSWHEAR